MSDNSKTSKKYALQIIGKEDHSMKYQRPGISLLGQVTSAVRGFNEKFLVLMVDSQNQPWVITLAAYEADE
jgi:hypothetical protein